MISKSPYRMCPDSPVEIHCANDPNRIIDSQLATIIQKIQRSAPMMIQEKLLARIGQVVRETPILWKSLPGPYLRVIFPVIGAEIEEGTVAALVVLHDMDADQTLYVHPIHAGPAVNPLLANLDGPMAHPTAQTGKDGDRAKRRMIEHKSSLWARFCRERETVGSLEAGQRWRSGYHWALRRLYFCSHCPGCRWGTPCFDGNGGKRALSTGKKALAPRPFPDLGVEDRRAVAVVLDSEPWKYEKDYAAQGQFHVLETPYLIQPLDLEFLQIVFPMEVDSIQGGTLVALAAIYHKQTKTVWHAHCLSAGPEPEILFLHGKTALGLPDPMDNTQSRAARAAYADWRGNAWTRFWLNELEEGNRTASQKWLEEFWFALEDLFGGNRLSEVSQTRL